MALGTDAILELLDEDVRAAARALLADLPPPPYRQYGVAGVRQLFNGGSPGTPLEVACVGSFNIPGPDAAVPVRYYRNSLNEDRPVLLYFHGGGFTIGSLDGVDHLCRALCALADCVVVSVDYRLAPEHPFPAAADDCLAVYQWTRANARSIGGNPDLVAVAGDSAGGNLALSVCHSTAINGWPRPECVVVAYPATADTFSGPSWDAYEFAPVLCKADAVWFWSLYMSNPDLAGDPRAVPLAASTLSELPPALVISAEVDPLRSDYEEFAELAVIEGAAVTLRRYDGVLHGFFTEYGVYARTATAVEDAAAFLRDQLG
jgi:acetyl esterase